VLPHLPAAVVAVAAVAHRNEIVENKKLNLVWATKNSADAGFWTRRNRNGNATPRAARRTGQHARVRGRSEEEAVARHLRVDCRRQENEIGPSLNPTLGSLPDRSPAPGIKRQSNDETMVSVSRQLFSRVSMTAGFYHRTYANLSTTVRTKASPSDYTPFTVAMPAFTSPKLAGGIDSTLTGVIDPNEILTVYSISQAAAKVFGSGLVDFNVGRSGSASSRSKSSIA
jgi:hypothetical protein